MYNKLTYSTYLEVKFHIRLGIPLQKFFEKYLDVGAFCMCSLFLNSRYDIDGVFCTSRYGN